MKVTFEIDVDINGLDTTVEVEAIGDAYDYEYYVYHNGEQLSFSKLGRVDRENIHNEIVEQFRNYIAYHIESQL